MRRLSDGRVRRSRDEWQEIMDRFRVSGLSEAEFCRREKLSPSRFSKWRRQLPTSVAKSAAFVEVVPVEPATTSRGEFELSLPSGVTLRWKA